MELKTEALGRILDAVSPALAAELDKIVSETREELQREFQQRLSDAVQEAQATVQHAAELQLQQAMAEAREATRKQITEELEQQFNRTTEEKLAAVKAESAADHAKLQDEIHLWRTFAEAQQQLAEAGSQAEILARFVRLAEPFAAGLGVYIVKADGLGLWKSRGQGAFPEFTSEHTRDPGLYFRTVAVREKTVAAICAAQPYRMDALDFLVASLQRAIEVFGLKLRVPQAHLAGRV